ncbi:CoA transferase [Roseisalinus antarcticus]|uniref:Formyl-coenzyme A transferase n=1 Tax=Roseisalinus antarcticus TaxID=254357 RepID=A0A1Y5TGC6_9RHOB|nr:CoA transferase [Roseisalinus antarcticus]SLN61296.1 Formyl-coenzyme A transferase [Roseisalinus antarcticus]
MQSVFVPQIDEALGPAPTPDTTLHPTGTAELPSCFAVSDLATASIGAAARELAALMGARQAQVDRRLASLWFGMTLQPEGWDLPAAMDPLAGDYPARDGWIRLHTNAPRHREAALGELGCAPDPAEVAAHVAAWSGPALEQAIIDAGGAAAAMRSLADWAQHPQGRAVAAEPLIAWQVAGDRPRPAALQGLKVLDLTRVLAGPVATRCLAGFGADVLRIDPPWWREPGLEPEVTLGKRRAGLDLRDPEDRSLFDTLLSRADVLVHGYRPGALAGLGYDAAQRRRIAPGMIEVSLCAYGWTGPWARRRGFDSLVQMSCGIADHGQRLAGAGRPQPLPVQALDHATGYLMAAAVLRAVRAANETGEVRSARLSLARVAQLLVQTARTAFSGAEVKVAPADLAPGTEATDWGPARRLRFPIRIDGRGPDWPRPAGRLRTGGACLVTWRPLRRSEGVPGTRWMGRMPGVP